MQNLSIVILTKNEEKNIEAAVLNAKQCADKIIVVDSGSTDETVILAERAGAEVLFRAWDNDFAAQRNFVLDKIETEWVLYLDADERLNLQLIDSIKATMQSGDMNKQYVIKRYSHAFGQKFRHGVLRPDSVARLFPRGKVFWVNRVHERPECNLPKLTLNGNIIHYTYSGWTQWLRKFEQYTTIWANDAYKKGKKTSPFGIIAHASFAFIQVTFLRLGFLDGFIGFVMCCNHFFYTMIKYLKLYELQRRERK